jgi:hypothetical protein
MEGLIQKPSVMNGIKVCKGCVHNLFEYKHGHDLTCLRSEDFGMSHKQKEDAIQKKDESKLFKSGLHLTCQMQHEKALDWRWIFYAGTAVSSYISSCCYWPGCSCD